MYTNLIYRIKFKRHPAYIIIVCFISNVSLDEAQIQIFSQTNFQKWVFNSLSLSPFPSLSCLRQVCLFGFFFIYSMRISPLISIMIFDFKEINYNHDSLNSLTVLTANAEGLKKHHVRSALMIKVFRSIFPWIRRLVEKLFK